MSDDTLVRLAQEIENAQNQALQITPPIARTGGLSMSSAYTVAAHIHASRCAKGDVSVGRKIGFTNAALWDVYGVREPIWGHMYERTVTFAQGPSMQCSLAGLCEPKIEPEIVLHFSRAPDPNADAAEIARCIDWVAHGFEIVQSNYAGWRFQAADTVADSSLHGRLCVGERVPISTLGSNAMQALQQFEIDLFCNQIWREKGRGSDALGSPLLAVAHLLQVLASQPPEMALKAGEMVTTGTLTAAYGVRPGERWHTELAGISLPGLLVSFVN